MKKLTHNQKNELRLNEFLQKNNIALNNIEFWRLNYGMESIYNKEDGSTTTIVKKQNWQKVNYYTIIGMSENNSFVVIDKFGKKDWIKEEFYNSSSSPFWKEKDKYSILVRIKHDLTETENLIIYNLMNRN
jgi:hypothetical protein